MLLSEFKTNIRNALKRGSKLDNQFDFALRTAVREIERKIDFAYMEKFGLFPIDASSSTPRLISFPNNRVKSFEFIRIVQSSTDGAAYVYLDYIDPADMPWLAKGIPTGYWRSGTEAIWLNRIPQENYTCEIMWKEFSDFPTDGNGTHWLLDNASDLLLYRVMLDLSVTVRDTGLQQQYSTLYSNAMTDMENANTELQYNSQVNAMGQGQWA